MPAPEGDVVQPLNVPVSKPPFWTSSTAWALPPAMPISAATAAEPRLTAPRWNLTRFIMRSLMFIIPQ